MQTNIKLYFRGECGRQVFPIGNFNEQTLRQVIGGSQGYRVYDTNGIASTQASEAGGLGAKTGLYAIDYVNQSDKKDLRTFSDKGIAPALQARSDTHKLHTDIKIRRLTPRECERLQGFPDNWTAGESDTQRYKMAGNAVTVNVVEAVMRGLMPCL